MNKTLGYGSLSGKLRDFRFPVLDANGNVTDRHWGDLCLVSDVQAQGIDAARPISQRVDVYSSIAGDAAPATKLASLLSRSVVSDQERLLKGKYGTPDNKLSGGKKPSGGSKASDGGGEASGSGDKNNRSRRGHKDNKDAISPSDDSILKNKVAS